MAEPLDNPLWASLTTLHAGLALGTDDLRRYPADVAPFVAARVDGAAGLDALVAPGETVFAVGPRPAVPAGWRIDDLGTILQMVASSPLADAPGPATLPLGDTDRPDVLELAALVYPHYYRPRTPLLGRTFGIRDGGRLAAMAGERMGMPGYREISAVCTRPNQVGLGLARRLLAFLVADLLDRQVTPFLHVSPGNTRAVRLYEHNGFVTRTRVAFAAMHRP